MKRVQDRYIVLHRGEFGVSGYILAGENVLEFGPDAAGNLDWVATSLMTRRTLDRYSNPQKQEFMAYEAFVDYLVVNTTEEGDAAFGELHRELLLQAG